VAQSAVSPKTRTGRCRSMAAGEARGRDIAEGQEQDVIGHSPSIEEPTKTLRGALALGDAVQAAPSNPRGPAEFDPASSRRSMVSFDLLSIVLIYYYGAIPSPARTQHGKQYQAGAVRFGRFELRNVIERTRPTRACSGQFNSRVPGALQHGVLLCRTGTVPNSGAQTGPGSAVHHCAQARCVLHRARDTRLHSIAICSSDYNPRPSISSCRRLCAAQPDSAIRGSGPCPVP
jgi:hypothetical protein